MQKTLLALLFASCWLAVGAQPVYNTRLKAELDSMYHTDQQYREYFPYLFTQQGRDSIAGVLRVTPAIIQQYIIDKMNQSDSLNIARLAQIIEQYGYPGKTLVGSPTNEAAFFIIQHSKRIDQYLPIVKKAVKKNELAFPLFAMMLDRSLMYNEKEQVYGTQAKGFEMTNPATGLKEWKMLVWPIKDAARVNKRRKKAGFTNTVEENAKLLGVNYYRYTLEEVKKMMKG